MADAGMPARPPEGGTPLPPGRKRRGGWRTLIRAMLRRWRLALPMLAACAMLAACSTSGRSFETGDMMLLQRGRTTLEQASRILHADPVNVYYRRDGSALAIWAHKASLVTDAVYFRRELWLTFGPDGTFRRVVERTNVPAWSWNDAGASNSMKAGAGAGGAGAAAPAAASSASGASVASAAPAAAPAAAPPALGASTDTTIYQPAVSYGLPH